MACGAAVGVETGPEAFAIRPGDRARHRVDLLEDVLRRCKKLLLQRCQARQRSTCARGAAADAGVNNRLAERRPRCGKQE
jgi:hypothetical protein